MLECVKAYLKKNKKIEFKFLHISTDEVFGSINVGSKFTEGSPYNPMNPYSASKASSDHLVRAWNNTYDLPTLITNCSNNYGPYQFPEKLVPKTIIKAIRGEEIPLYGDGKNIRDWLFVDDHVRALFMVLEKGKNGESYNIGSENDLPNIELVRSICNLVDRLVKNKSNSFKNVRLVRDRPGHDSRYAIDPKKITNKLN